MSDRTRLDIDLQLERLVREHALAPTALAEIRSLLDHVSESRDIDATDDGATTPAPTGTVAGRYRLGAPLGRGGMGEVLRAWDERLERAVAFKRMTRLAARSERARARFWAEATLTASLQHPGIIPVYDRGEEDGQLWYTMRLVEGDTFGALIEALHAVSQGGPWQRTATGWSFRALVEAFRRACEAVAFAHRAGVVHRDLSASNIMIGPLGEVLVMDWGLARHRDDHHSLPPGADPTSADALRTRDGVAMGTPGYMSPEQARGDLDRIATASDVFALGAVLYELLSGMRPYADGVGSPIIRVLVDAPTPVAELPGVEKGRLPDTLVRLAERCLQRDPARRPLDAAEVAAEVARWLDGDARRAEAERLVDEAEKVARGLTAVREEIAALQRLVARRRAATSPYADLAERRQLWAVEDKLAELARRERLESSAYVEALQLALRRDESLESARVRLAAHHQGAVTEAERKGREDDAAVHLELVRRYDDGRLAAFIAGERSLSIETEPSGAALHLDRLRLRDRQLHAGEGRAVGTAPARALRLGVGRYLLRCSAPGHHDALCPLRVSRDPLGTPSGDDAVRVRLLPLGTLADDDRYVPAGWFWSGGDARAIDALEGAWAWVDDFVIQRDPVTNRAYLAFLNGLVADGRASEAVAWAPGAGAGGHEDPDLAYALEGEAWQIDALDEGATDVLDWPVVQISRPAAEAYARWWSQSTGQSWGLPDALQWEKAMRGVDGRAFPWGDHAEPTWACVANARPGRPSRESVHAFPTDVSVYGVRGGAGGVREWCASRYTRTRSESADSAAEVFVDVRGGAWGSPIDSGRLASRFASPPDARMISVGFRLARTVE